MPVACASTACIARVAMQIFKRRYYRSNSIRKAIAQFTANLIFYHHSPRNDPGRISNGHEHANRFPQQFKSPPAPLCERGAGGFSRYTARGYDAVIPRNDSSIAMVDAKLRAASPKFLLSTGIPVD